MSKLVKHLKDNAYSSVFMCGHALAEKRYWLLSTRGEAAEKRENMAVISKWNDEFKGKDTEGIALCKKCLSIARGHNILGLTIPF